MDLRTEPEKLFLPLGDPGEVLFPFFLLLLELGLEPRDLFRQLGDLTPVAQDAPVDAVSAPARQDAARTDDIPLRRDEGPAETVLSPERDAAPEVGNQKDVAQQLVDDRPAILLNRDPLDQRDRFLEMFMLREGYAGGARPDLEGDEASAAEGGAFQVVDRADAVRLAFHHDILKFVPEDSLDGRFIFPGDLNMVGNKTEKVLAG